MEALEGKAYSRERGNSQVNHPSYPPDRLDSKAKEEMREWNSMTNRFLDELKKFQMVCYYCAEPMNEHTVNQQCEFNSARNMEEGCKPYFF